MFEKLKKGWKTIQKKEKEDRGKVVIRGKTISYVGISMHCS